MILYGKGVGVGSNVTTVIVQDKSNIKKECIAGCSIQQIVYDRHHDLPVLPSVWKSTSKFNPFYFFQIEFNQHKHLLYTMLSKY